MRVGNATPKGSLFWRLLVIAGEGSRFTLIEESASTDPELESYSNAVAEVFVERGAKLEYVSIQNLSRNTWHFATHRARVAEDAELDWVAGGFGSRKGKITIENRLAGQGATSRVTGAYFADGDQHLDYDTLQEHEAPNTTSDFAFKGVLRDKATSVWRGMIKVERDAQKTNAYQENRNLLLSPKAHADSIPGLEILANDVRCTHGATVSQVNRDELFYCMARGLSRSGGRAPDRPRFLPGDLRPHRARPRARRAPERPRGASPRGLSRCCPPQRYDKAFGKRAARRDARGTGGGGWTAAPAGSPTSCANGASRGSRCSRSAGAWARSRSSSCAQAPSVPSTSRFHRPTKRRRRSSCARRGSRDVSSAGWATSCRRRISRARPTRS